MLMQIHPLASLLFASVSFGGSKAFVHAQDVSARLLSDKTLQELKTLSAKASSIHKNEGFSAMSEISGFLSLQDNGGRRKLSTCDSERTAIELCIPSQACAECMNQAFEATIAGLMPDDTCIDVADSLCPRLVNCDCLEPGCLNDAEAFYGCIGGCGAGVFECDDTTQPADPAETEDDPCATALTTLAGCVGTVACAECANDAWSTTLAGLPSSGGVCSDVDDILCPGLDACTCLTTFCKGAATGYYGCIVREATGGVCPGVCIMGAAPLDSPAEIDDSVASGNEVGPSELSFSSTSTSGSCSGHHLFTVSTGAALFWLALAI